MVGKLEFHPPAVDIERISQVTGAHHRAFGMPAGIPPSGVGIPPAHEVSCLGLFPEGKVLGVAFFLPDLDPGAFLHFFEAAVGQFSVFRILAHIEIDRSVDFVGQAGLDHFFNRFQLFRNVAGGPGADIRTDDAHPVHRLKMPGGVGFRNGHRFQFQFPGTLQHFVLTLVGVSHQVSDIGYVLHVKGAESAVLQVAQDDVETDIGLGMAEVTVVVNRRSADIKRHPSLTKGNKVFFLVAEGVVEAEAHEEF